MAEQNQQQGDLYITKAQLMERLDCSRSTVQRMMRAGLPHIRYYGNYIIYQWDEVVEWLNENNNAPPKGIDLIRKGRKLQVHLRKPRYGPPKDPPDA